MKAISIKQPWVDLILSGRKTIETRFWKTNLLGDYLICCSKYPESPLSGKAVAVITFTKIRKMLPEDEAKSCVLYSNKLYAWEIENVRLIKPFSVIGKPGIFQVHFNPEYL